MLKFILKFQNCLLKNLAQNTIVLSTFRAIDSNELENFNVVFTYPNEECVEYFLSIGFEVYQYDKLPLNSLIFSKKEFLDFLLDDDKMYPDTEYPIAKVIYLS
jgi:hypothetical protein